MNLEKIIYDLLKNEPFYAHFILNSHILYDKYKVETAGAAVVNGVPQLVFNSKFMSSLSQPEQTAVLKHEILHLLFDHSDTTTYAALNKQVWNVCMDVAINQHIKNLPSMAVTVDELNKIVGRKLLPYQSSTYYYNEMYQHAKETGQLQTLDQHDLIEESSEDKQIRKGAVAKAAKAAQIASAGIMPDGLESVIESLNEKPLVNWKQQLRNFAASAVSSKTKGTRTKMHRRFGLDAPGKKKKRELKLAVCLDSSGSVSNEQFAAFINEVVELSKYCAEINLIYADCEVQKVINLKNNAEVPTQRYGNGGTAYQPAITKAVELGANAILLFGDLDCADTPTNPGIPFLWVTVGSTQRPGEFGRVIELK